MIELLSLMHPWALGILVACGVFGVAMLTVKIADCLFDLQELEDDKNVD